MWGSRLGKGSLTYAQPQPQAELQSSGQERSISRMYLERQGESDSPSAPVLGKA